MKNFHEAAEHYLAQWLLHEEDLFNDSRKNSHDPEWIKSVLKHFNLKWGFPHDDLNLYEKLSHCLATAKSIDDPCERVAQLAKRLSKNTRGVQLSAASKLLWMYDREHVIIIDGRVDSALNQVRWESFDGRRKPKKTQIQSTDDRYSRFFIRWTEAYTWATPSLGKAIKNFPPPFASSEWFKRRAFDIWLWHIYACFQVGRSDKTG